MVPNRLSNWIGALAGVEEERGARELESEVLDQCVAIGTTAKGTERWDESGPEFHGEGVALPPLPGAENLRIAGFMRPCFRGAGCEGNRLSACGCHVIKTTEIIRTVSPKVKGDRPSLQRAGNKLYRMAGHRWIANEVAKTIRNDQGTVPVVLEGVRKLAQIDEIQVAVGHRYVRHVHLSVDRATQKERFIAQSARRILR